MNSPAIYTASKTKHAHLWRDLRSKGHRITSTWIDEAEPGQTKDMGELWSRIDEEVLMADALLIYRATPDEVLKGAYVELGMAVSNRVPIFAVGFDVAPIPSFMLAPFPARVCGDAGPAQHLPLLMRYPTIDAALAAMPERLTAWGE